MQTLSEKAKGKQRAVPIPENGGPIPPRELMVRFTEGVQDLVLQVAENDSVRDVKAKVSISSLVPCSLSAMPIVLIYIIRFEKRAPNSTAVVYASSTLDGSSPTGHNYHPGLVPLKSASSAPLQKSKTNPTHRYRPLRCPPAAPQPRFHGYTAP